MGMIETGSIFITSAGHVVEVEDMWIEGNETRFRLMYHHTGEEEEVGWTTMMSRYKNKKLFPIETGEL